MAKKDDNVTPNVFGGFEALSNSLVGSDDSSSLEGSAKEIDPEQLMKEVEKEIKTDDEIDTKKVDKVDDDKKVEDDVDDVDNTDNTDNEDEDNIDKDDITVSETDDSKPDDLDEYEVDIAKFMQDKLEEELGWEFGDDDKLKSVKDVVDFMSELVTEGSKPEYASEDVAKLDQFVKDGGNLVDFVKVKNESKTIDSYDIENESDQKSIIRELLQVKGYDSDKINRAITRYDDAGVLEEEAEDSLDLLKKYKDKEEQTLLDNAKKQTEFVKEQQQMFVDNVQSAIKDIDSVRGVKISSKEKQELLDYIFKPDTEGITQYQKEYSKDIKNLIESAYFTKKGDVLIDRAKKDASSKAYKELHQKLKANKDKRTQGSIHQGVNKSSDSLSSLSKILLNR